MPDTPGNPANDRVTIILNNLINNLENGSEKDRLYAIEELDEMPSPKAIPVLIGALADPNQEIKSHAEKLLEKINPNWASLPEVATKIPYFISKLNHSSNEVWRSAARWLSRLYPASLPFLVTTLEDSADEEIRLKTIQIISQIDGDTSSAVPALIKATQSNNFTIRENALKALATTGDHRIEVLEALGFCLEDSQSNIRLAALETLATAGEKAAVLSNLLVRSLLDIEPEVRDAAAKVLAQAGSSVVTDLLALVDQREDLWRLEMERIRKTKGELFKGIDEAAFLLEPRKAMQNVKWHFADMMGELTRIDAGVIHAIRILSGIKGHPEKIIKMLESGLQDPNPKIIKSSIKALGTMGPEAKSKLPDLLQLFQQKDQEDYELIVHALNAVDPQWARLEDAQPFLDFLIQCLGNNEQRPSAILALKSIDPEVVQHLISGLENKDRVIKKEIILLLGALGPQASAAIPLLKIIAAEEENRLLREASREAVKKIGFN